jgi:hypothetical protein
MSLSAEQLYDLMPAIYRVRDASNGLPLQALMQVIAGQSAVLEDNIRQLYDDEFIETCASWVIPYIGDLVGASPVYEINAVSQGRRAEVANTIGYRRRKGTLLALEQVAMDVSGMPAFAVEFFKRVITTQSMRHLRPENAANVNLRNGAQLDGTSSAFDTLNRTIDVRRIGPRVRAIASPDEAPLDVALHGAGKYNVPDVGMYLWRWKPQVVTNAPAFHAAPRRYMFSPLGQNMPLFTNPPARASFAGLTERFNVPQPIRRREFFENPSSFYGDSFSLIADNVTIPVTQICCRDLTDWACAPKGKIAIDPMLGRILFASDLAVPKKLRLNFCYGFPADLGGGPYDRSTTVPPYTPAAFPFFKAVDSTLTIESAVKAWNQQKPGVTGMITVPDFETLPVSLTGSNAIAGPEGSTLWIVSSQSGPSPNFMNSRVVLDGNIEVRGKGQLFVNGVWISGSVHVRDAASVQFSDCTLVPGISLTPNGLPAQPGEPNIVAGTPGASISLMRTISGPIGVREGATTRICSSVVDAGSPCSVAYAADDLASEGADLHIEDSTVVGKIHVRTLELASNTIFMARRAKHDPWAKAIWCGRKQSGCVRFCFVPVDSITPRKYRCLPADLAREAAFRPQFVTLQYGDPSYALLSGDVPMAVWTGADNGSQMGVYKFLEETEAVRNVQLRMPEFLPYNLDAGVFLEPSATVYIPPPPTAYGYGALTDPCGDSMDDELWNIAVGAHLI